MTDRSEAQRERQQRQYRERGRYAKVKPCYVCKKSAGIRYFSHAETDVTIGPGTNAGTGYPITARCVKCNRRSYPQTQYGNPQPTGRTRKLRDGERPWRNGRGPRIVAEYRCGDCGHTGWTKHPQVTRAALGMAR